MAAQQVKRHSCCIELGQCVQGLQHLVSFCGNQQVSLSADQKGSKRKSAEPDLKAKQRMQGMFKRAPARAVQRPSATDQSSEDLLSDILGSIGGDDK